MKRLIAAFAALFVLVSISSAQQADLAPLGDKPTAEPSGIGIRPAATPFSLLDLSRINWSHSYSVAFFSGGGTSGSVGLWNTRFDYELSESLHLAVNLGVMHNPGALWDQTQTTGAKILPGLRLDYRPSDNFQMTVSFQQYSGYYSPYSAWGPRRYYRPLFRD